MVEITSNDGMRDGVPTAHGLYDPALGVLSGIESKCPTCGCVYLGAAKANDCPGHFGHIEVHVVPHPSKCGTLLPFDTHNEWHCVS